MCGCEDEVHEPGPSTSQHDSEGILGGPQMGQSPEGQPHPSQRPQCSPSGPDRSPRAAHPQAGVLELEECPAQLSVSL